LYCLPFVERAMIPAEVELSKAFNFSNFKTAANRAQMEATMNIAHRFVAQIWTNPESASPWFKPDQPVTLLSNVLTAIDS